MNPAVTRVISRWIHIVFGVPVIGYIYSPFQDLQYYARSVRFFFLPILILSGLWMWKGHLLRRLTKKSV